MRVRDSHDIDIVSSHAATEARAGMAQDGPLPVKTSDAGNCNKSKQFKLSIFENIIRRDGGCKRKGAANRKEKSP